MDNREITIKNSENEIVLPLENGKLDLMLLQVYFPSAVGLIYEKDGKRHGLKISNNFIEVHPKFDKYWVYETAKNDGKIQEGCNDVILIFLLFNY